MVRQAATIMSTHRDKVVANFLISSSGFLVGWPLKMDAVGSRASCSRPKTRLHLMTLRLQEKFTQKTKFSQSCYSSRLSLSAEKVKRDHRGVDDTATKWTILIKKIDFTLLERACESKFCFVYATPSPFLPTDVRIMKYVSSRRLLPPPHF